MFLGFVLIVFIMLIIYVSEKPVYLRKKAFKFWIFSKRIDKVFGKPKTQYQFYDLCPVEDLSEKACGQLFKFGLENKKVKNIAITGPYGSGKSSFLKSFEYTNNNYKYLNISLATFKNDIGEGKERVVEENILQQIIYKEPSENFPNSRIKRIKELSLFQFSLNFLFFYIWINAFYLQFKIDSWHEYRKLFLNLTANEALLSLIFIGGIFYAMYSLSKNFGINKIVIKAFDNEVELGKTEDTSIFYKHLDEILYFFKKTNYNVVFFEDIDRFEKINIELFTKLRELNGLLNQSKEINRDIKFVYAVKDDLFEEKEENEEKSNKESHKLRTKFFDLIIPIIPVVNFSNSKTFLKKKIWDNFLELEYEEKISNLLKEVEKLKKDNVALPISYEDEKERVSHQIENKVRIIENLENDKKMILNYLNKYAIFINDMRLLNNIVNEFIVFRNNINTKGVSNENLNDAKLVGYIIYKNLYPKDFSDLHNRCGKLFKVIDIKLEVVNKLIETETSKLIDLEEKKKKIQEEFLDNFASLRFLFINKIITQGNVGRVGSYTILDIVNDEDKFLSLKEKNLPLYEYNNERIGYTEKSINDIEVEMSLFYEERKKNIEEKNAKVLENVKSDIIKVKEQLKETRLYSIKKLCEVYGAEKFFDSDFLKESLLVSLLKEGIIDEKEYETYISYFYEGDLSYVDREFLISVRNGRTSLELIDLVNPKAVINELTLTEFSVKNIINYRLIKYLLEDYTNYKEKIEIMFEMLNRELFDHKFMGVIIPIIDNIGDQFISTFATFIPEFWDDLGLYDIYTGDQYQDNYLYALLVFCENETILKQNNNKGITRFLYENNTIELLDEFMSNFKENSEEYKLIESKLSKLLYKICDTFLSTINATRDSLAFKYFYENSLYEINLVNIKNICGIKCALTEEEKKLLDITPYTIISERYSVNKELTHLKEYIDDNIQFFVDNIILSENTRVQEIEKYLLVLFNFSDEYLSLESKIKLIESQTENITKISDVSKNLYQHLLHNNKIVPSWENMLHYYENSNKQLDATIIDFLNQDEVNSELGKSPLSSISYNADIKKAFDEAIVKNEEIALESFNKLLPSLYTWSIIYSLEDINSERVDLMIKADKLVFNDDHIDSILTYHPKSLTEFLFLNRTEFIENPLDYLSYGKNNAEIIYAELYKRLNSDEKLRFINNMTTKNISKGDELHPLIETSLSELVSFDEFSSSKIVELNANELLPVNNIIVERLRGIDSFSNSTELSRFFSYRKDLVLENMNTLNLESSEYLILYEELSSDEEACINFFNIINMESKKLDKDLTDKLIDLLLDSSNAKDFNGEQVSKFILNLTDFDKQEEILLHYFDFMNDNNVLSVFALIIEKLKNERIRFILKKLGGEFEKMSKSKQAKLKNTPDNIKILQSLKEKSIVSSFPEDKKDGSILSVYMKQNIDWKD